MSLYTRILTVSLFLLPAASPAIEAAVPGLPLLEDFSSTELRDAPQTLADWSTAEQALLFGTSARRFDAFATGQAAATVGSFGFSTASAALGDVDGDGDLDLVTGNVTGGFTDSLRLFLNNGSDDPWAGVAGIDITPDLQQVRSVALGDVDGDGDLDLVAGIDNGLGGVNRLYLNDGTADPWPGVSGTDITADSDETNVVVLADMDGDGDLDLVVGNEVNSFEPGDGANKLYLSNGTADPFGGVTPLAIGIELDETTSLVVGDLDGDGDLDVVAGNFEQPNRLYLNNGTADPFSGVSGVDVSAYAGRTLSMALGDVDGDGDLDLVEGDRNIAQPDRLYLNNGSGDPFAGVTGSTITSDAGFTQSVALADADADGDLDLFVGRGIDDTDRLFLNNGSADPWSGSTPIELGTDASINTNHVVAGDVDGDGGVDLVAATSDFNEFYRNPSTRAPWEGVSGADVGASAGPVFQVELGDMDGDGDLDAVVGRCDLLVPNRLYLNNGTADPWLGVAGTDITSDADCTLGIALGDVDGDGDLDVVAGNDGNDGIPLGHANRLYLNNGSAAPFAGVSGLDIDGDLKTTYAVALGDVDGDGDLDLVAGDDITQSKLYLNDGSAIPWSAANGTDIGTVLRNTTSLALGDVDGDGDLDLVEGNGRQGPGNRLFFNNGTADPFNGVSGVDITTDTEWTQSLVLGDVDGDGDLDLVAGNTASPGIGSTNRLYLNDGSSDPWNGVSGIDISADVARTQSVRLADVDRDGDLDLLASNSATTDRLYLNDGGSEPWAGVTGIDVSADTDTFRVAVGDVDGNGTPDLVSANAAAADFRLYLGGKTSASWSVDSGRDITTLAANTTSLLLADVDSDGDLDLVAGNINQANRLYLNDGNGEPWDAATGLTVTSDVELSLSLALGDVDGDGDLDLVDGIDGVNRLYLSNGSADPWNGVTGVDLTLDVGQTESVALGDVDGDGDLDLVAANYNQPNRLYLNNGSADPWNGAAGTDISGDANFTRAIALGDVDNDGDLDLVEGNDSGSRMRLYLNNGSADPWNGVSGVDITNDAITEFAVALGDVDGDGDLDLVTGNFNQACRLYLNNGSADPWNGASGVNIAADADTTHSVALADVDGDGDLDLVAGNQGQPNRLYLNNGTADPWNGAVGIDLSADADSTRAVALGDVDRDGSLDLVAGNITQRNRLYRTFAYDTSNGRATSLRVDTEVDPITNATLTPMAALPPNTAVDYWLSNDGGSRWYRVRPGVPFGFPAIGFDLRWRAELGSRSPALTPRVDQIELTTQFQPVRIGDRVWEDLDGDGIQDGDEPGFAFATVLLLDEGGVLVDSTTTDIAGNYSFDAVTWGDRYSLRLFPPPGYALSPAKQGPDDAADSDFDPVSSASPLFTLGGFESHTRWDAGLVLTACESPDEPIFLSGMSLTTDGNDYPILTFQDPNQPSQITGYNVYRNSAPAPDPSTWPLVAGDVIDMDEATPNKQWVDTSGDLSPSGIWYYVVTAFNGRCPEGSDEGPF